MRYGTKIASLVIAVTILSSSSGAMATSALPNYLKSPQRWSASWMGANGHVFTQSEAVSIAKTFDLVVAHSFMFKNFSSAMHQANPRLKILAYVNGTWAPETKYPASWYARDSKGNRIKWIPFNTYLLQPNEQWRRQVAQNCSDAVAVAGYDGCMLDNLGLSPVNSLGDKTGAPVNPSTNAIYTRADWMTATSRIARYVRAQFPSYVIVGNGGGNGGLYFSTDGGSSALADNLDAVMIEQYLRGAMQGVTAYPKETEWKRNVDMVVDMQARGSRAMAVTKLWTSATKEEVNAWHQFALATFLLATDGTSFFQFLDAESLASTTADNPWDRNLLGRPLGAYTHEGSTYRRQFEKGKVIVNPTKTTVTVPLGQTYKTLAGVLTSSITLGPSTATVLRLATASSEARR